ncbi:ubiquitin carboxyl-terminal hydrolase 16/45-like isoform X2 [Artemia franciscana]|uniref:ubiquitin carboxyl-terminal hydrolase 16/45-like isoform X2 n=1 Tax=Artemia franciscana TaxID=6661 RepID=UPI0032DB3EB5
MLKFRSLSITFYSQECQHLRTGVDRVTLRKYLKQGTVFGVCSGCKSVDSVPPNEEVDVQKENIDQKDGDEADKDIATVKKITEKSVWICMNCGYQGCGKSHEQHAYQHYKQPRTGCHSVAVDTTTWIAWCYACDNDVLQSPKLQEAITFLRKLAEKSPKEKGSSVKSNIRKTHSLSLDTVSLHEKEGTNILQKEPKTELTPKDLKNLKNAEHALSSLPKVKGLSNLGNTCFFNSVIQIMSQTHLLSNLVDIYNPEGTVLTIKGGSLPTGAEPGKTENIVLYEEIQITLQEKKPLTLSFCSFLKDMHRQGRGGIHRGTGSNIVNPGPLLSQIRKKSPMFRDSDQHDSQELLRHFLDGLKTDELERNRASILRKYGLSERTKKDQVNPEFLGKLKFYDRQVSHTLVDQIFSGQLISTLVCETCKDKSQRLENFLDLSLSISEEKPSRPAWKKKPLDDDDEDSTALGCFKINNGPSKHQLKKGKKAAKTQKKKLKNRKEPQSVDEEKEKNDKGKEEKEDIKAKEKMESDEEDDSVVTTKSPGESPDESDADVEDNAETESLTSRTASTQNDGDTYEIQEEEIENLKKDIEGLDLANAPTREKKRMSGLPNTLPKAEKRLHVSNEELFTSERSFNPGVNSDHKTGEDMSFSRKKAEWYARSLSAIAPRYQPKNGECSILSGLNQFTAPELLFGTNSIVCEGCTKRQKKKGHGNESSVHSPARKQLLIFIPPAILTIHLKRFTHCGTTLKKVNRHVGFPLILDLAPFCSAASSGISTVSSNQNHILYSLYGVVEHSGRLDSGHYTACVKVRPMDGDPKQFLRTMSCSTSDIDTLIESMTDERPQTPDLLKELPSDFGRSSSEFSESDLDNLGIKIPSSKWYYVSDTQVNSVDIDRVLKSQAYLLFYERIY